MNMKKINIKRFIPLIICLICAIICFTLAGTVFSDGNGSDSLKFSIDKDSGVNILSKKAYSERIEIQFTVSYSGYYTIYSNSYSYCGATLKEYDSYSYLSSDNVDGLSHDFNVSSSLSPSKTYILTVVPTRSTSTSSKINITIKKS